MQTSTLIVFAVAMVACLAFYAFNRYFSEDRKAQRDLDAYLKGEKSPAEIGLFYERYVGYVYENNGYQVSYNGANNRFNDLGRDLIAIKGNSVHVIQTKYWAKHKVIHEKHIFQLYGSTAHYRIENNIPETTTVLPVFCTTANYSDTALAAGETLNMQLGHAKFDRSYPLIKCNVNINGERIYHLPFDKYYDKINIQANPESCYVKTVKEAMNKGFRRAKV